MSGVAQRLVGVELGVAGFSQVPEEALRKKLGHRAWHVWQVLCARRNRQGLTHITVRGIANADGFVRMHEENVRSALKRLRAAQLVEDRGWCWEQVPTGATTLAQEVYVRRIRGARMLSVVGREQCAVPHETKAWVATAAGHGGKRMKAGRPKKHEAMVRIYIQESLKVRGYQGRVHDLQALGVDDRAVAAHVGPRPYDTYHLDHIRPLASFDLSDPEQLKAAYAPSNTRWLPGKENVAKSSVWEGKRWVQGKPLGSNSCAPEVNSCAPENGGRAPNSCAPPDILKRETGKLGRTGEFFLKEEHPAAEAAVALSLMGERSGSGPLLVEGAVGVELRGGTLVTPPMPSTPLRGLPAYPGHSVVSATAVPPPLKLDSATQSADFRVRHLAAMYRGAVESQYGGRCHLLTTITPKAKSYAVLLAATDLLEAYGVPPAAWCLYAVRKWRHIVGAKEAAAGKRVPLPPINTVFSAKSIEARLQDEDTRESIETYAKGGRVVFGKTHLALLKRYGEMRTAVTRGTPREAALAHYFPGTSYDDMVDTARREAAELRHKMEDDVKRNRMLWGA